MVAKKGANGKEILDKDGKTIQEEKDLINGNVTEVGIL